MDHSSNFFARWWQPHQSQENQSTFFYCICRGGGRQNGDYWNSPWSWYIVVHTSAGGYNGLLLLSMIFLLFRQRESIWREGSSLVITAGPRIWAKKIKVEIRGIKMLWRMASDLGPMNGTNVWGCQGHLYTWVNILKVKQFGDREWWRRSEKASLAEPFGPFFLEDFSFSCGPVVAKLLSTASCSSRSL